LPLKIIPPPYDLPLLAEAMQWHHHFEEDPGSHWLRGLLKEAAMRVEPGTA
jgi:hypothetical protein